MKNLLITYHSKVPKTSAMAEAVLAGAQTSEAIEIRYLDLFATDDQDLLWADAIILGTPENFGYMSGALKDFFDRTFYVVEGQVSGLPYGLFVSAGNDGSGAVMSVERIVGGYPFKKVCDPVIGKGPLNSEILNAARELGQTVAAGLEFGIF